MTYDSHRYPGLSVVPARHYQTSLYDDPIDSAQERDRVTHLVFVDGRLLEAWSEPAEGTRWEGAAQRLERDAAPRPEPPPPPYVGAREWLIAVCGGPARLAALDDSPLTDDEIDLPPDLPDARTRHRLESAAELIDSVAAALFDAEISYACRRALLAVWAEEPEVVLAAPTAAHLVGGICWAVGRANGLYGPRGVRTQASVQEALALRQAISGQGQRIASALRGLTPWAASPHPAARYGTGGPDLLALGRPELLASRTRHQLVQLRDRVERAEAAFGPAPPPPLDP
ncbi:MAG: hypothetical protein WBP61_05730 [Nocardioides sp.]